MARPGLHWPNRNDDDQDSRRRFVAGRFSSAVVLTVTPPSVAAWLASRADVGLVVGRLYEPAGDLAAPADVAARHGGWIRDAGARVQIQILNEPDLEYPRLSPEAFAAWWLDCAGALRASFPGIQLGFPAPSIAASDDYWSRVIGTGVLAHADFIGERGYWQRAADATSPTFGRRWQRSAGCGRPIYLTEFGCSSAQTPKVEKGQQYVDYCASLPRFVAPVGVFIGAGGDPRWDSAESGRLWIDDAMARQMGIGEGVFSMDAGTVARVLQYGALIVSAAVTERLSPSVVAGLIAVESGGNARAVSPDNGPGLGHAKGLMQVLPLHFVVGEDPFDPATNLRVGCRILGQNLARYKGRLASALAAYFGAVDKDGNPTSGHDVTGTTGVRYVLAVEAAATSFAELDPLPSPSRADADFLAYAPLTGTWREASVNLKGIADDALATGRKVVSDAAAIWGSR